VTLSFALQVAEFAKLVKAREDAVLRWVAEDILIGVVRLSPVDTGLFRGNWQIGINSMPSGTVATVDKGGGSTIAAGESELKRAKAGDAVHIVNNLPYAQRLEYGWSQQAPNGMMRITVARFEAMVAKAAQRAQAEIN